MSQLSRTLENSFNRFSDRRLVTLKSDFVYDRYTYGTIKNISLRLVTFFEKNNIKKGDKVTICSYNSPQYIYTFLASIFSGVILVPIDYGSSEDLVKKFMEKTESKFLITSKYKIINLKIKKIFIEDMDEVLASHKKGNIDRTIKDEDLFQILFTSGTTGDPKGVKISHENILSNIRSVLRVLKIKKHYRLLSLIPLSHIFEQVAGFFIIAASGAQTTQLKSRRPSEIIKIFQKEKINVIATVPAFLMLFKRKIENKAKENRKFKKLKKVLNFARKLPLPIRRRIFKDIHKVFGKKLEIMISGGAPLPRDAEIFWESTGIRIVQGYGLTETSPVLALGDIYDRRVGSVGKVVPGVRMKLNDDGEVLVRGKNITKGYYKNPEATEDLFENGWLKTGDVGKLDDNGFLFIKGRLKNMILKPSGLNVYPEDIEDILNKMELVKDSCVIGIDKGHDVIVTAVVIPNKKTDEKSIKKTIDETNKHLENHQKIQDFIIWKKKDFPRTLTFKVKRLVVEKEVENKTHEKSESKDEIIHILSTLSHLDAKDIKEDSLLFSDLGFDSLKVIELSTQIEELLRKEIDEYLINSKTTIKNLRSLVEKGVNPENKLKLDEKMFWPVFLPFRFLLMEFMYFISSFYFKSVKVKGKNNINKLKGQYIIIINHSSHLDFPTLAKHLPLRLKTRLATGAAADYFFRSKNFKQIFVSKFFTYLLGSFPLSRIKDGKSSSSIKQSFEFVGEIVDRGWSIGLSPEGTRSKTGKLNSFKNGIGTILKETKLPVIPIKLNGLHDILPPHSKYPLKRGHVEIIFGKPIKYPGNMSTTEITKSLEKTIRGM